MLYDFSVFSRCSITLATKNILILCTMGQIKSQYIFCFFQDLGGLLKSLYDAVAISLPQTGTKTLKLRLTVSPDKTAKVKCAQKDAENGNDVKTQNNHKTHDHLSKLNKDTKLTRQNLKQNNLNMCTKFESAHQANLTMENLENVPESQNVSKDVKNTNLTHCGRSSGKARLSEKRHLADLVQQNMDRHQQQLRWGDAIFRFIFLNQNCRILNQILLKWDPKSSVENNPALVQIEDLAADCGNSSASAVELLQSCTKPSR